MRLILPALALILILSAPASGTASEKGAEKFVSELNSNVLSILNSDEEWGEKEAELHKLFLRSVDVNWIAKFVVGKHWRRATEDEKKSYLSLYPDYSVSTYASRFKEYSGETIDVLSAKASGDRYAVEAEIKREADANIYLTFHIWEKDGKLKIFDLVVEGVSMLNTQRSEFGSIITRRGMGGLIERLTQHSQ